MKTITYLLTIAAMAAVLLVPVGAQAAPTDPGSCVWVTDRIGIGEREPSYIATTDGATWESVAAIKSWSPDRRKIITINTGPSLTGDLAIRISNPDGSASRVLSDTLPSGRGPIVWSPDGTKIALQTREPGTFAGSVLQIINVANGAMTRISDGSNVTDSFVFSPDSNTIVWAESRDRGPGLAVDPDQTDVYRANADGSGSPVRIIETAQFPASSYALDTVFNPPGSIAGLTFSPDGTKLAFTGNDFVGPNGAGNLHDDLWVANADGTGLTQLRNNHSLDGPSTYIGPAWSPDGSRIAVAIETFDFRNAVLVLDAATGATQRSIPAGNATTGPKWSPDGSQLAYVTNVIDPLPVMQQVRISNPATGTTQTVWTNPEDNRFIFPRVEWVPCTASMPRCNGKAATIIGTNGSDRIRGTKGRDVVVSFGGADNIKTFGGNDLICAGPGHDRVWSGSGKDRVYGEAGNDTLKGGSSNDRLYGQAGKDTLVGNKGNDKLFGAAGKDKLKGGSGNDLLNGGKSRDKCTPGAGNDRLRKCP